MLRLKPSELTLTPEDVEETLRRMARRQQARPPAAPGQRRIRTSGRPPAPREMPGAQRSVGDAITDMGEIPSLRPQPQQAIIAHVDDESEDFDDPLAEPARRAESSPDPISESAQPVQLVSTFSAPTAHATRHTPQLSFRLERSRRRQDTEQDASLSSKEKADDFEGTLIESANSPTETTNDAGPATPGHRRANEDSAAESSPTCQPCLSVTPAGLRGGASHHRRDCVRSIGQDALHAPSSLRPTQIPSPALRSGSEPSGSDEESSPIYLQGHFERKRVPNMEYTYTFRELIPRVPRTEPLRRTSQPRFHTRSHSSNDAPASRLFIPTTSAPSTSTGEDVFWTAVAPADEHLNDGRAGGRRRLHSSEMSNTSLAYSYYELPDTRQSSGEHSAQDPLSQSQYDGAAASKQASRGTYRSVRLPETQARDDNVPRFPISNTSSSTLPVPGLLSQLGASPLPAEPYARLPFTGTCDGSGNNRNCLKATIRRTASQSSQDSSGRESHSNAVTAAIENHISPLDTLTARYGRVAQRLADQQGQTQRNSRPRAEGHAYRSASFGPSAYGSTPSAHAPPSAYPPGGYGLPSGAYGSQPDTFNSPPNAFAPPMAMADDPYTRGVSANVSRPHGIPHATRPVSAQHAPTSNYVVSPHSRGMQAARSGQRSSENAPVGSTAQGAHAAWTTQVQNHLSHVEQTSFTAQSR
jgi:hypothetical protein